MKTLLIIEDEHPTCEALASIFRLEGFHVVTARNRQEALRYLRTSVHPNLILLDMGQVLDGSGFLEELRHDRDLAWIPVVVLMEPSTDRDWVASLGATDSLAKPVSIDTLLTTVQRWGTKITGNQSAAQ
jgi:DNA-binding response OmpR family regulator